VTDTSEYKPPEVWVWEKDDSPNWRYSNTNRPVAGATHEKELPRGKHPLHLRQSIVNWGGATWATRHVLAKPMPKVIDCYFMIVGVIVGSFVVAITFGIPVARWLLQ
jgi:hypothetical protein